MERANPPHPFIKVMPAANKATKDAAVDVYSTKLGQRTCGEHGMISRAMIVADERHLVVVINNARSSAGPNEKNCRGIL